MHLVHHMEMKRIKPYQFIQTRIFYLLFLQTIGLWSCSQKKTGQDHLLSIITMSDSATVYSGELDKNTPYQKIAIEESTLKNLFAQKKKETEKDLIVYLKLSFEGNGGILGHIEDLIRWAKESGIDSIELVNLSKEDQAIFNLPPVTWSHIDSLAGPTQLELVMPKDEEKETPIPLTSTVTIILTGEEKWFCYSGSDISKGRSYEKKEFGAFLSGKRKQLGSDLYVIIKPTAQTTYKETVDALDQMTLNKIDRYSMVKLNDAERSFLKTTDQSHTPPEPVAITTPGTAVSELPDKNAFLIEIKEDNSVWYQPLSPNSGQVLQKVKDPVSNNLQKIIADHEAANSGIKISYLIKGHPKTSYPVFEKVINALKENNIFKYNLVTSPGK
jgi:biopolymer transport protein ExbD